ncbi:unnamed protein product [Meloidogyne enterolobii]|uniref:Uncharacterized protein n=1 Tax=Meloidogyne enterolobii TaxID=390850 RepID=A0ACB1ABW1_MELEN
MNSEKGLWEENNFLSEDDDKNSEVSYSSSMEKEGEQVKSKTSSSFRSSLKKRVNNAR